MKEMLDINEINIPKKYKEPSFYKLIKRFEHFENTGKFLVPIILNNRKDKMLIDGYTSYVVAKKYNLNKVEVQYRF